MDNTPYTWIVTRDTILGDANEVVGKIGPSESTNRAPFDSVIIHGEYFRMLNDAGVTQFSGYIVGRFAGPEPLDGRRFRGRWFRCVNPGRGWIGAALPIIRAWAPIW
jgi:hypothetical protein